jgi:hypothetical protein
MDRRTVIPAALLVLLLIAFTGLGLYLMAVQPDPAAARGALRVPEPSASSLPQLRQTALGATMSGDFADRDFAALSVGRAPSVYIPSDRWRFTQPGAKRHAGQVRAHQCPVV